MIVYCWICFIVTGVFAGLYYHERSRRKRVQDVAITFGVDLQQLVDGVIKAMKVFELLKQEQISKELFLKIEEKIEADIEKCNQLIREKLAKLERD